MRLVPFLSIVAILFVQLALGQNSDPEYADKPMPGEQFKYFFKRITRGGQFPGIILDAPSSVQEASLKRLRRRSWQGPVNSERRRLQSLGVDLWFDWYREEAPMRILAPNPKEQSVLGGAMSKLYQADDRCQTADLDQKQVCRSAIALLRVRWSDWTAAERQAFSQAFLFAEGLVSQSSLFEPVAMRFGFHADEVSSKVSIKILDEMDFEKAVRKMGWGGPIYFRGITGPDPDHPGNYWILLHDTLLRKMTAFDYSIYQSLEYVLILSHELSHVAQDLEAKSAGLDLRVNSAESALVIEGMAESISESALLKVAEKISFSHPLKLFIHEQADEVVNRPGNDTTGNLFPYTIGFPFITALYDLTPEQNYRDLNLKLYQAILGQPELQQVLFNSFK